MPFTVSHAAVVLPLFRWRRLDPVALVIGSMAPDFGYFLSHFYLASQAHAIQGSIVIALPLAWPAWIAVRCLASVLCAPLPEPDRGAAHRFLLAQPFGIPSIGWITFSLLLGIWSHTILDSVTHASGWTVSHVELLRSPWPVYKALQHAGSIAGMLVLFAVYARWRYRQAVTFKWQREHTILATIVVLVALAALPSSWSHASRFEGALVMKVFVFRWIVGSMALFAVAYVGWGFLLRLRESSRHRS